MRKQYGSPITVRCDNEMRERLDAFEASTGKRRSDIIRECIMKGKIVMRNTQDDVRKMREVQEDFNNQGLIVKRSLKTIDNHTRDLVHAFEKCATNNQTVNSVNGFLAEKTAAVEEIYGYFRSKREEALERMRQIGDSARNK